MAMPALPDMTVLHVYEHCCQAVVTVTTADAAWTMDMAGEPSACLLCVPSQFDLMCVTLTMHYYPMKSVFPYLVYMCLPLLFMYLICISNS